MVRNTQNFDEGLYLLVQLFFLFFSNKWRGGSAVAGSGIFNLKMEKERLQTNFNFLMPLCIIFFCKNGNELRAELENFLYRGVG